MSITDIAAVLVFVSAVIMLFAWMLAETDPSRDKL